MIYIYPSTRTEDGKGTRNGHSLWREKERSATEMATLKSENKRVKVSATNQEFGERPA